MWKMTILLGLLFVGCANNDEIDTRLNKQPPPPVPETHVTFATPVLTKSPWTKLRVSSVITGPQDPVAFEIAKSPDHFVKIQLEETEAKDGVLLTWEDGETLLSSKIGYSLVAVGSTASMSTSVLPLSVKLVTGPILVQIHVWKESANTLQVLARTWPLFPLKTLNSHSLGTDLLMQADLSARQFQLKTYQQQKDSFSIQRKDFDLLQIQEQFHGKQRLPIPAE
jgi:hypothetical protein